MKLRSLLLCALIAALVLPSLSEAGPLKNRRNANKGCSSCYQESSSFRATQTGYNYSYQQSGSGNCKNGVCPAPTLVVPTTDPFAVPTEKKVSFVEGVSTSAVNDALNEVNAKRAARGLPPYTHDPALTMAAHACASARAARLLFGHTANDFQFLPPGSNAAAAGCAAYDDSYGWMSCAIYDNYRVAGAAWVRGADGKRYMHLFVR